MADSSAVAGVFHSSLEASKLTMGWLDISVFLFMLLISALIGVYFAYFSEGGNVSATEYLVGGRSMGTWPIALSLVASYISGITILGYPAEVYVFGMQIMYKLLALPFMGFVFTYQFLPVFRDLQGMSLYGYFARRFDKRVRLLASSLFVIGVMCWMPVVMYVPALAFEQVTTVNVHWVTPAVCLVCIYYTTVGGLKAVVWTDAVQAVAMLVCVFVVMMKGLFLVGGPGVVWELNVKSTRLEGPVIDFDPTTRHTFFTMVIGAFIGHCAHAGLSQAMVQRYLALPTNAKAVRAMWGFVFGITLFFLMSVGGGLILFAYYHDCDPVLTKRARTKDQLLPLLVMDTMKEYPGLPGLFIAGVFSAALSSMSTGMNSLAAVVLEDWVRGFGGKKPNETQTNWIMKGAVVVSGVLTVLLVFVVERLGMVLQLSSTLSAISTGPLFTLFIVGLFLPWCNTKSALAAAAASCTVLGVVLVGAQSAIASGDLRFQPKPTFTDGCMERYNLTEAQFRSIVPANATAISYDSSHVFYLFRISYLWYVPLSVTVGLLTACVTALAGWRNDLRYVNPSLLAPTARRLLPYENRKMYPPKPSGLPAEEAVEEALLSELKQISHANNGVPSGNKKADS